MNDSNPYRSPTDAIQERPAVTSHGTGIRKEAWRGARFGAKITALVLGGMILIGWLVFLVLFICRWVDTGVFPLHTVDDVRDLFGAIGSSIALVALTSFYAGIGGAVVMGTMALFRKARRSTDAES